ncbi:Neurexin-3a Neurexin IIIa-alpha [Takifugu flavidus]|uniref:Neurexin-3a Neurexin IIIa-alpha n=1 Tax=Takifugu flavidus TaxID=433684 RepID=A0A5C6NY60_9TELE|nr:Neurexin-3a Neurexin IIIa-alpha [Takifugu flavidus]
MRGEKEEHHVMHEWEWMRRNIVLLFISSSSSSSSLFSSTRLGFGKQACSRIPKDVAQVRTGAACNTINEVILLILPMASCTIQEEPDFPYWHILAVCASLRGGGAASSGLWDKYQLGSPGLVFLSTCLGMEFLGTPGQWARYLRWDASTRGDLSFQLKTEASEALLLYFDDGGYCDFLQLSVTEGRLQLRFSIDCAETTVVSNGRVDDGSWHLAALSRYHQRTVLALDGQAKADEVRPQRLFMKIVSDLFLGGVPQDIRNGALTLPTVRNMQPFRGTITDLKYGISQPQFLGSLKVLLESEGWCTVNPCENGGTCLVVDAEPVCDCSKTEYKGRFCNEEQQWNPADLGQIRLQRLLWTEECQQVQPTASRRVVLDQMPGQSPLRPPSQQPPRPQTPLCSLKGDGEELHLHHPHVQRCCSQPSQDRAKHVDSVELKVEEQEEDHEIIHAERRSETERESEPDKKGGDSPERVKGWGSLCLGDKCGTEVKSPSVARADP